jgi:hypothetical protein
MWWRYLPSTRTRRKPLTCGFATPQLARAFVPATEREASMELRDRLAKRDIADLITAHRDGGSPPSPLMPCVHRTHNGMKAWLGVVTQPTRRLAGVLVDGEATTNRAPAPVVVTMRPGDVRLPGSRPLCPLAPFDRRVFDAASDSPRLKRIG